MNVAEIMELDGVRIAGDFLEQAQTIGSVVKDNPADEFLGNKREGSDIKPPDGSLS